MLGLAMFRPRDASALLAAYPGELALASEGPHVVGVIGYRIAGSEATVAHIAVDPAWRGRGIGRALVDWLAARVDAVVAETDAGAAGFYRRCGYAVEAAGDRMGTPRYVVRWRRA